MAYWVRGTKQASHVKFYVNLARNWVMFNFAVAIGATVLKFPYYPYFCLPCLLWAPLNLPETGISSNRYNLLLLYWSHVGMVVMEEGGDVFYNLMTKSHKR